MMMFGNPVPWWLLALLLVAAAAAAYVAYAGAVVPLSPRQRWSLRTIRAITLLLVILFFLRPIVFDRRDRARNAVVPILIDRSRSMGLADADGETRLARAKDLVERRLLPSLGGEFQVEVLSFGEAVEEARLSGLEATARRSDLAGAIAAVGERYAGRSIAGVIVVSDGGDTGSERTGAAASGVPVFSIGVGARRVARDREVLSVTAGEAALADSVVDLSVAVVSHGFGRQPMTLTVRENGQPIHVRSVTPGADDSPVQVAFQVSPKKDAATLYAVEVAADASEITVDNNARSALVQPPGRRRRLLLVEGSPGFEHGFLKRALDADPGLEVDAVVRKGRNDRGADTFYVRAAGTRAAGLVDGYPATRDALFAYDALVFANVEADVFTRDQLDMTADFVGERGGGLLVLGARSFEHQSWLRTPIEDVLPVELADRSGLALRAADRPAGDRNRVILASDGERHPIMRLGTGAADTRARWASAPALASIAAIGGPRAGATVLADAMGPASVARPLVAVQRYGEGRSMVFTGEASWRWKMRRPADDRLYDTFWRQAARWLAGASPDPVAVSTAAGAGPGDVVPMTVTVRDRTFAPVRDATVILSVSGPGGAARDVQAAAADEEPGKYVGRFRADQAGVYRVRAEGRRGGERLGVAESALLVGGADDELSDPRLNEDVLRRIAFESGGALVEEHAVATLGRELARHAPDPAPPVPREIWHNAWAFLLVAALAAAEWTLRRRWGMR
jgi:uncharacterized membrane protein